MNRIKLGILGCGTIAQYAHLPAAKKSRRVTLNAVCDRSENLARSLASQYQVPEVFSDHREFLGKADIEAVVLAVPDPLHVPLALECLRAGKHVLVEKPVAQNPDEAMELLRAVNPTGLKILVGNMKRHDPGIGFARDFVFRRLGTILSANGWYCDTVLRPQLQESLLLPPLTAGATGAPGGDFKADKENYNLITHGVHLVNTLQFLGGPIARLVGKMVRRFGAYSWHAVLEYAGGAIGHLELSVKIRSDWREGFEVHGENGSVTGRTFLPFFKRPSAVRGFDIKTGIWETPVGTDSDPYKRQLDSFAASILDGAPIVCSVEDGIRDLRVIRALKQAAETGNWVEV